MTTGKAAAIQFFFTSASGVLLIAMAGCGRYADFTLPVLPNVASAHLRLTMRTTPVIPRGAAGEWDSGDVLNPAVVRRDGSYMNFYSGFDGKVWRTGLALSSDGEHWEKKGSVLSPAPGTWEGDYIAANGSALLVNGEYWYWYQAGARDTPRIGLARSADGRAWRKEPAPVLDVGPVASWDERAVADPYVLQLGEWFYLYYLGQDRARRQQLGLARSHDGLHWEKLRANPVMEVPLPGNGSMDENGLGEPAVWQSSGLYWMLFTGRDAKEERSLGLAHSTDGVHWERTNDVFRGAVPWDAKVLCDPTVVVDGDRVHLWFGGGDVASPDENLHGQIGAGELKP